MTHKALIKQLEDTCLGLDPVDPLRLAVDDVIEALRENAMREVQRLWQDIEQPKVRTGDCLLVGVCASEGHKIAPQRTWVGLTNDELTDLFYNTNLGQQSAVAQAIALLKQKNGFAEEKNT